jgi:Fe-S-cluster-containing hydrogenase component 2
MDKKRIKVVSSHCTGCRLCTQICAIEHFKEINPKKAAMRVEVCPEKAIYQREDGAIIVIKEKCTNCGECIPVCRPEVIFQHADLDYVIICDNCFRCTELCNTGAITIYTKAEKESA